MANSWFRMYSEFVTDPKVQMLSEANQRRLTMLFCIRCNGNVTLQDEEVTFLLRISYDEWIATKSLFIDRGFINISNEILNWNKRQFVSDTSKNRVAAYRERKKGAGNDNVTLQKHKSNAIDTEQIQNRTDTEHTKKSNVKIIDLPEWLPEVKWVQFKEMRKKIKKPLTQTAEKLIIKDLIKINENGFDPIEAIDNSIKNSWQGIFEPKSHSKHKSRMDISGIDYKSGINEDGSF